MKIKNIDVSCCPLVEGISRRINLSSKAFETIKTEILKNSKHNEGLTLSQMPSPWQSENTFRISVHIDVPDKEEEIITYALELLAKKYTKRIYEKLKAARVKDIWIEVFGIATETPSGSVETELCFKTTDRAA